MSFYNYHCDQNRPQQKKKQLQKSMIIDSAKGAPRFVWKGAKVSLD